MVISFRLETYNHQNPYGFSIAETCRKIWLWFPQCGICMESVARLESKWFPLPETSRKPDGGFRTTETCRILDSARDPYGLRYAETCRKNWLWFPRCGICMDSVARPESKWFPQTETSRKHDGGFRTTETCRIQESPKDTSYLRKTESSR